MAASAPEHGSPAKQDTAARLVIVGGVAGGATAAARARRLDDSATITVFEKGPHVSFANCGLPYFVGGEIPEVGEWEGRRPLVVCWLTGASGAEIVASAADTRVVACAL